MTAVWILIVAGMFFGPSYLLCYELPGRLLDATYVLFVLGWITVVTAWANLHGETTELAVRSGVADRSRFVRSAALGVLGVSLLITGNTRTGIAGMRRGIPQAWNRMVHTRDRLIRAAVGRGESEFVVPAWSLAATSTVNWAKMHILYDVTDDPTWFVNKHIASYYGLKTIGRKRLPAASPVVGEHPAGVIGHKSESAATIKR